MATSTAIRSIIWTSACRTLFAHGPPLAGVNVPRAVPAVVFDARANYQITDRLGVAAGIDDVTHRKYFLYHPFPQRTFTAELKLSL